MIPVYLYNAQELRCSTSKSLINHPLAVCDAELVKSFKEISEWFLFSFELCLIIWPCCRQLAWGAVQRDHWAGWICQLRSPEPSPGVPGKSNQLGAYFLACLRCFHTPQKSFSHPIPRGAFVCWHLSQLSVTRKLDTGRGCRAHRSRLRDYLCLLGSTPRVAQALSGQNK